MTRLRNNKTAVRAIRLSLAYLLSFCFVTHAAYGQRRKPITNTQANPRQNARPAQPSFLAKAKGNLDIGRNDVAIQYAAAALKQNPNLKTAVLIMAQGYYRMGNAARSAKLFSTLRPEDISADASLEYTLALFATKRYKQAAVAWQRVPHNSPYRDIALFYGGVSYIYLKQYARASSLLRRARNLPANLRSDRRRLLDDVDNFLARSREGLFSQDQAYAYQAQPQYTPTAPAIQPPASPGQPTQPAEAAKPPPPPPSGFTFTATPTFTYEILTEKLDMNGYEEVQTDSRIPIATMPSILKYTGEPRSFGGQSYLSLTLTPGYEDIERTTTKSSLFAPTDNPTAIQTNSRKTQFHSARQMLVALAEVFFPFSDPLDFRLNYLSDHSYYDSSSKKDRSVAGPSAKVTIEAGKVKIDGSYASLSTDDLSNPNLDIPKPVHVKTENTMQAVVTRNGNTNVAKLDVSMVDVQHEQNLNLKSATLAKLTWDKTLGDFSLGLGGIYNSRTAYEGVVLNDPIIPRSEQGGTGNLVWTGPFGIVLTLGLNYIMFSDFEYKSGTGDEAVIYPSSGTAIAYNLLASIPLFGSYGGLDFAYRYTDRKLTPAAEADEATQMKILQYIWSQRTVTSFKLTVKYPL